MINYFYNIIEENAGYCSDICGANARREQKKRIDKKIRKKEINLNMQKGKNKLCSRFKSKPESKPGFDNVPRPKLDEDGNTDWEGYHESLAHKMKVTGMTALL